MRMPQEIAIGSPPHGLDMFPADLLRVEIPQQPVVVGDEPVQFTVPFFGQTFVELLDKRQQRSFGWEFLFMTVNRNFRIPTKSFAITGKSKPVKKVFSPNQRDVPQTRDAVWILLDGDFK